MKSIRECIFGAELDLPTLVWTRGRDMPLSSLEARLKCPRCGSRRVTIVYDVPSRPREARA
jgi:DNA-directed RNA polymerase subunit RPC12/RpoP